MSWSFTAIQVFPVCWLSPCAAKHSVMGYVLSQSQQWTSLSCETQEICLCPSGHCLGCSNRNMDDTFPNSLSRIRKPIIPPLLLELRSNDTRKDPDQDHLSGLRLLKKQKGRVGKNFTGAMGKFYELKIHKAQRLEFTTHEACFVK